MSVDLLAAGKLQSSGFRWILRRLNANQREMESATAELGQVLQK